MAYESIIFEKEDNIAIITFNRPEARNAVNNQVRAEFAAAIAEVEADDEIKVMILTGNGKAFASGVDIKEFNKTTPYHAHNLYRLGEMVEKLEKPVIAAVNGYSVWVAVMRSPWAATSSLLRRRPSSASPKSISALSPAAAAPSACRG